MCGQHAAWSEVSCVNERSLVICEKYASTLVTLSPVGLRSIVHLFSLLYVTLLKEALRVRLERVTTLAVSRLSKAA